MKKLPVLRASATKRWLNCTWFSAQAWPESPSGPEAQAGTRVHNGIARACGVAVDGDGPRDDRERALVTMGCDYLKAMEVEFPGWTRSVELTLEWSSITGEDEVVGHADVLLVSPAGDEAVVIDWKTGRMHDGYDEQLATYAWLARFNNPGVKRVTVILAFLAENTEVRRILDAESLQQHSAAMGQAISRRSEEQPTPTPGAWCQWCPAALGCPKNDVVATALALGGPGGKVDVKRLSAAVTTDVEAAQAHAFVAYATEAIALIEANLKAYVREHGAISTAEGQRYAPSKQTRRTVDVTPECVDVLRKHGVEHVVEPTTTWAAVKKAAGKDKSKAAQLEQDLIAAGALRVTEFETWTTK
jgi:hypothetical protein